MQAVISATPHIAITIIEHGHGQDSSSYLDASFVVTAAGCNTATAVSDVARRITLALAVAAAAFVFNSCADGCLGR